MRSPQVRIDGSPSALRAQERQLGKADARPALARADAAGRIYEFEEQVFMGSTAHKVIQLAGVPVTLVK